MGLFDKLPFKKKEDPFDTPSSDFDKDPFKTDIGQDPFHTPDPLANNPSAYDKPNFDSMRQTQNQLNNSMNDESLMPPVETPTNLPGQPAHPSPNQNNESNNQGLNLKDHQTELILSKLDTIKLNIENINLRLNRIENEIQTQKRTKNTW